MRFRAPRESAVLYNSPPMPRAAILNTLLELLGPLGPFGTPEEREAEENRWISALDERAVEELLELVLHPPSATELGHVSQADLEFLIAQALGQVARRDPAQWLPRFGSVLSNRAARPAMIEAIGMTGTVAALGWLAPLVDSADLSEDESIRLACALGEIGGDRAKGLLERQLSRTAAQSAEIRREIEIALEAIARSG